MDGGHLLAAMLLGILKSITSNTFRVLQGDNLHAFHNAIDTLEIYMTSSTLIELNFSQ
jgi:hypothetical protein